MQKTQSLADGRMLIRPATYNDLVPASKLLARAFNNEYLFVKYIHPHVDQYPDDMYLWFLHKLRVMYFKGPDHQMFVAYKQDDNGHQRITGFSYWHRQRAQASDSLYNRTLAKTMEWYNYFESFIYPNRAAEPSRLDVLSRAGPFVQHHWTGSRAEVWDLDTLGVDPAEEGQGIGRALVNWGFQKAREEGVGCSVISSDGKAGFYEKCGFDQSPGMVRDAGGEQNPMLEIPGGKIHFWDNGRSLEGVKTYGQV